MCVICNKNRKQGRCDEQLLDSLLRTTYFIYTRYMLNYKYRVHVMALHKGGVKTITGVYH